MCVPRFCCNSRCAFVTRQDLGGGEAKYKPLILSVVQTSMRHQRKSLLCVCVCVGCLQGEQKILTLLQNATWVTVLHTSPLEFAFRNSPKWTSWETCKGSAFGAELNWPAEKPTVLCSCWRISRRRALLTQSSSRA